MKLYHLVLLLFVSTCNAQSDTEHNGEITNTDNHVVVTMEGKTHRLDGLTRLNTSVTKVKGDILFYVEQDSKPMQINFNVRISAMPVNASKVFKMPEANYDEVTIDLSFFNLERNSKRMQKRILFNEGVVEVLEYSPNKLRMTFNGSGSPLLSDEKFPIVGLINIEY